MPHFLVSQLKEAGQSIHSWESLLVKKGVAGPHWGPSTSMALGSEAKILSNAFTLLAVGRSINEVVALVVEVVLVVVVPVDVVPVVDGAEAVGAVDIGATEFVLVVVDVVVGATLIGWTLIG